MITTIVAAAASVITFVSVVVLGQTVTVHHSESSPQSTATATPLVTPSATASATPTPSAEEIRQQAQANIDQATAAAKLQIDQQRQAAIERVEQQFEQAKQQAAEAKLSFPVISGQPNPMEDLEQQL
jgi:flagellar biosynthesis/type III secretory pathway protein FliH